MRKTQLVFPTLEESLLVYLRRTLAHHHLTTETSSHAGLERILEGAHDVILCDLMMPEMTGIDLYHETRRSHPDLADRMIFMTAGVFMGQAVEAIAGSELGKV